MAWINRKTALGKIKAKKGGRESDSDPVDWCLRVGSRSVRSTFTCTYSVFQRVGVGVFNDTVSGAPETAPIEQSVCHPPPPAVHGHTPALCGITHTCLGIVAPSRRFYAAPMPLHHLSRHITPT